MRVYIRIMATTIAVAVAGCGGGTSEQIEAADSSTPILTGVAVASDFQGTAMVGEPYESEMSIVALDSRNSITSLTVENATVGGSQPVINSNGKLVWKPNAADFTTRSLTVRVVSTHGEAVTLTMPTRVGRTEILHRIPIGDTEGVYSDPDGDFQIRVYKDNASLPVSGTIIVKQRLINTGGQGYEYEVENGSNYNLEILEQPSYRNVIQPSIATQSSINYLDDAYPDLPHTLLRIIGSNVNSGLLTTRGQVQSNPGNTKSPRFFEHEHIASIISSCMGDGCKGARWTKEPIILMHGYNVSGFGGGAETWGELPSSLIDKGHPVFEVRWRTYMRFEEAAHILNMAIIQVARLTGKKATILAHSFGGIAAHTLAQGKAEFYVNGTWKLQGSDQIAKIITINSPLSGISLMAEKNIRMNFSLSAGRDFNDPFIAACTAVTCFQAGEQVDTAVGKLGYIGLNAVSEDQAGFMPQKGSVIEKIQKGTTAVPYHVVVGMGEEFPEKRRVCISENKEGWCVNYIQEDATYYNSSYGDGLISFLSQAVRPEDFLGDPFDVADHSREVNDLDKKKLYGTTYPLKSLGNLRAFNQTEFGKCLKYLVGSTDYRICRRSVHTNSSFHRQSAPDFGSPYYEKAPNNRSKFRVGYVVNHPLHDLLINGSSPDYLLSGAVDACVNGSTSLVCKPKYQLKGTVELGSPTIAVQSATPASSMLISLTFEHKTTGAFIRDFSGQTESDGTFTIDLATPLRERLGETVNPTDYRVQIKILVQGYETYRETLEDMILGDNQLAGITLKPKQANLISISGKVIDGQTASTGIDAAIVRLVQGADLDVNTILARTDAVNVNTLSNARKLITAADGSFSAQDLRSGTYSVLVTKSGYLDQLQGRLTISSSGGVLSLSMLRTLPAGANSITLRWDNGSVGTAVSSDLDSHLLRLNGGTLDYHINYSSKTVPNSTDSLDRDDQNYEGPETVTFAAVPERNFVYYVHNYAGGGTSIIDSRARVILRYDGRTLQFSPPISSNQSARYWRVFDIVNGSIVRCVTNCLQDVAPLGISTQGGGSDVSEPWRRSLSYLPRKN